MLNLIREAKRERGERERDGRERERERERQRERERERERERYGGSEFKCALICQFFYFWSSLIYYITHKNCFQGHEIVFGHKQQSLEGILALGPYIPAITWQCLRQKGRFSKSFFAIF